MVYIIVSTGCMARTNNWIGLSLVYLFFVDLMRTYHA